ncbi:unnamed protein product [Hymenolepis diminuta]|uniref:LITAF domain-containing protein n=1 Tax=Hymenolepis diminuta TaxID=6216 RepID=A0A158QD78_HYMDI|nr:unnamed protein product [Hymenolepis diminuta]VUZ45086.1 unnamed protein product [Hymenolepis diminuta]
MAQVPYTPGQTTVIIQQPTHLSDNSQQMVCPRCNRVVMSKTDSKVGTVTWLASCLIFFLGGPLLCCLIPFCCRKCKNIEHKCPNCGAELGLFKRI